MIHVKTFPTAVVALLWFSTPILTGCNSTPSAPAESVPPLGVNTSEPFPLDRGDDGANTPGTYKGLWLRLTDNGKPTVTPVDGVIGIVCIGMSNAKQECDEYIVRRNGEYAASINPAVRVVNCAVGGHAIEKWIDPAFDRTLWDACITQRLSETGVRLDQVRVVFHKAGNQTTTGIGGAVLPLYPNVGSDYNNFFANLGAFALRVKSEFPAVQAVYTSSRSYGGYSTTVRRGEPLSYEEGHALNAWLLENRSVQGVWYGWGPYLWAPACDSGGTNQSNVCYDRADFEEDGVHPSALGEAKMSALIHARFLRELWY